MRSNASSVGSRTTPLPWSLSLMSPMCLPTMLRISFIPRGLKMMYSSSLLRNSGLKLRRISSITLLLISGSCSGSPAMSIMFWDPMLEVKMMMVFLKSTVRPCPSVMRPSSSTCRSTLNTSGWAFSISSNSTTLYGLLLTASLSCPPSSYPTYPGGAPTRRDTESFSMYSDMSMRTICSSESNSRSVSTLASCVLPTPVGPRNMKEAMGLSGSDRPTLLLCTASAIALTASCCPTTSWESSSSSSRSFSRSDDCSLDTGIFVHDDTVAAMSPSVTSSCSSFLSELSIDDSVSASFFCSAGSVMYRSSAALLRSYVFSALSMSSLHRSSSSLTACTVPTFGFRVPGVRGAGCLILGSVALLAARGRGDKEGGLVIGGRTESLSICHCSRRTCCSSLSFAMSLSIVSRRCLAALLSSFARLSRSISSFITFLSILSTLSGLLVISTLSLAALSSIRSMALSGRNLSAMYLSLSTADATRAESCMRTPWCTSYRSLRPRRMEMVSSTDGASTSTCWKRLSSAGSFSIYLRCSSRVVAPMHRSCPLARRGLRRLDASIDPSVAPAPTTVCISSMNIIICPSASVTSLITALSLSSNSPLYFAPATNAPMSSENSFLPSRLDGTSPLAIRCASPSAMAVLPTPGSPMSTGLFFVRRERI
mmetsp:Transcript_7362/g.17761  ORF Transcript_7362/g.17761 Transcript_7362/m.17761 type:complete len:654 (+) Transcript_7362:732-2693(+)